MTPPNSSTSILFGCTGIPTTVLGVPAFFLVNQRASVKARSLGAASPVRPSPPWCDAGVWFGPGPSQHHGMLVTSRNTELLPAWVQVQVFKLRVLT